MTAKKSTKPNIIMPIILIVLIIIIALLGYYATRYEEELKLKFYYNEPLTNEGDQQKHWNYCQNREYLTCEGTGLCSRYLEDCESGCIEMCIPNHDRRANK